MGNFSFCNCVNCNLITASKLPEIQDKGIILGAQGVSKCMLLGPVHPQTEIFLMLSQQIKSCCLVVGEPWNLDILINVLQVICQESIIHLYIRKSCGFGLHTLCFVMCINTFLIYQNCPDTCQIQKFATSSENTSNVLFYPQSYSSTI